MIIFLAYYFIVCVFPIFLLNKFNPKIDEPEWKEINRMNAYMRSPEFIEKRDKLFETSLKGGDNHD